MKKIILVLILSLLLIITIPGVLVKADSPLDEIQKYDICIDTRDDGSLDMRIDIIWKVLDSKTDGPLEWVKIGIPNYHADEIKALSSNIDKAEYYSDDGAFIRIDFKKKYYKDDIVTFSFSFHQSYMYTIDEQNSIVKYHYIPGWFDEIDVKELTIKWNTKNVLTSSISTIQDYYYFLTISLPAGRKTSINLEYNTSAFPNIDLGKQYTNEADPPLTTKEKIIISVVIIGIVAFVVIGIVAAKKSEDPYMKTRGFSGNNFWYHSIFFYPRGYSKKGKDLYSGSSNGASHGGSCACACACACAGGGRAGCSRKDFYHTNLDTNNLIKELKKNE